MQLVFTSFSFWSGLFVVPPHSLLFSFGWPSAFEVYSQSP